MKVLTVGFTKKSASEFFELLRRAGVRRVVDIRLNNVSQLAGFSKKDDLSYFLGEVLGAEYWHCVDLAPTQDLLEPYKKGRIGWDEYEERFLALMRERRIEDTVLGQLRDDDCLLCSEATPHHCHRRLVAEYLRGFRPDLEVNHL